MRAFGRQFAVAALYRFAALVSVLGGPVVLAQLISYLKQPEADWKGFVWVAAFFVLLCGNNICMNVSQDLGTVVALQCKASVMNAIFQKALRLPAGHGRTGAVISMHATDTHKLLQGVPMFNALWAAPLTI
eukprot:gene16073-28095_t